MANINQMIREKLRAFPKDVEGLALKALELSELHSEPAVVEQLRSFVRDTVKRSLAQE